MSTSLPDHWVLAAPAPVCGIVLAIDKKAKKSRPGGRQLNGNSWSDSFAISPACAGGQHDSLYLQATAACLSAIVVMQMVNIFLCRHPKLSAFSHGHRSNRLIAYGIVFELVLLVLIDYTPWGNALFGTAPLGIEVWLFMIPFGLGMWLLEEVRKAVMRRKTRPDTTVNATH